MVDWGPSVILTADAIRALYTVQNSRFTSDANVSQVGRGLNVRGSMFCKVTSKKIGEFSRRFILLPNGMWHAEHQHFYITDDTFKRHGIGRYMFGRAVGYYATHGVSKISLDAVRDGRYVWLKYGFKPEPGALPILHSAIKRAYKRQTGRDMPAGTKLPRHGPTLLRFRFRGVRAGRLAVDGTAEFTLTMDLTKLAVRAGLVNRGWLPAWRLLG